MVIFGTNLFIKISTKASKREQYLFSISTFWCRFNAHLIREYGPNKLDTNYHYWVLQDSLTITLFDIFFLSHFLSNKFE